jgi:hypothetical protein
MGQSVARALRAIDRHKVRPEQIDWAIIAAINVTLCLASGGDPRVAEGFNNDIAASGRGFGSNLAHEPVSVHVGAKHALRQVQGAEDQHPH